MSPLKTDSGRWTSCADSRLVKSLKFWELTFSSTIANREFWGFDWPHRRRLRFRRRRIEGHFEAYARGVNAYIESHRDRLPIEFRILRYSPRPWEPVDSTLIAAQMVKDLNHYPYGDALDREKILAKLGPELTADLVRELVLA